MKILKIYLEQYLFNVGIAVFTIGGGLQISSEWNNYFKFIIVIPSLFYLTYFLSNHIVKNYFKMQLDDTYKEEHDKELQEYKLNKK